MKAFYGFKNGSGDWFLIIDTEKCNGCGACVEVCPEHALEVGEDESDPLIEEHVARVRDEERKTIRYTCALCQPGYGKNPPPCINCM
jgi:NAD-dependent dihydropyrimidine dehydrogenase PreA subunit